jgi:hypothetical protein
VLHICQKLKTNGNLLTDPNDVCNEFAKHFEQIANIPNDAPDDPDIVKRVSDFRTQCCDGERAVHYFCEIIYNLSKTKQFCDRTRANLLLDLMHFFHSFRSLFLVRLETDI